jgi:N-acetylmuramoyl-L-alanine amidase
MRTDIFRRVTMILLLLLLAGTLTHVESADVRKLVVYSPITTYSVDVIVQKGTEYIGLVELLEPLGHVEAKADGKNFLLEFTSGTRAIRARFRDGKKDAELPGGKINLQKNFYAVDGRGYVPLENLQEVVSQIAGIQTQLHASTRHLYLGGAGIHYSSELRKNPARLVLSFTAPVAPTITAEGTALRVAFTRDPVLSSGIDLQDFKDSPIQSTTFSETSAGAELIVHGSSPLVATSSDGGKTLTIATSAPAQAVAPPPVVTAPTTKPPSTAAGAKPPAQPAPTVATPVHPAYLVVIDAAHGGDDIGATLSPGIREKDVTLALSRRIAHELQNRGIQVTLLRNSDTAIVSDQRAITVNTSHAAIYVSVHASSIGHGLRIFTSLMPPTTISPGKQAFIPWNAAQSQYLDRSSAVSGSIAFECNRKLLPVRAMQGAVLPLNNIATAAVAIEIAPNGSDIESVNSAEYAQNIAVAVANGIAAMRSTEGEKKH